MYYDTVQFVMDVEDRFDITLPDVDAERICTMGDLCDYLVNRARLFIASTCPSASAFYKLRQSLTDHGVARSTVRPATRLSSLLNRKQRLDTWRAIGERFGTTLPSLQWRWRLRIAYLFSAVAALSLLPTVFAVSPDSLVLVLGVAVIVSVLLIAGYVFGNRFASVIPPRVATVGALSRWLVARCYLPTDKLDNEVEPWIWAEISEIVCSKMDVDHESLNRDTNFLTDLDF